jgi:N-succinyldiaminopimelate aminotransferase
MKRARVADRLAGLGLSIFTEMTELSRRHGAVNLGQGFPDFDGPEWLREAVTRAMAQGHNQYPRMYGVPELNRSIAEYYARRGGPAYDADGEVTVTTGCTEALCCAFLGLLNPGDEVVLFQPFFDIYRAASALSGVRPRFVTLYPPRRAGESFWFDLSELRRAFSERTRAIVVNTPHNPTGKVFTREELGLIAELCVRFDAIAITDEVYERLIYDEGLEHAYLATLPGMRGRTLTLGSLGKMFSVTGWKVGWAAGPADLTAGVRAAHQFVTFSSTTPMQHAAAEALRRGEEDVERLRVELRARRDELSAILSSCGFVPHHAPSGYFIMAALGEAPFADDREACRRLPAEVGVGAIPPSVFYDDPRLGSGMVRFAFCKRRETIAEAGRRLASLRARTSSRGGA